MQFIIILIIMIIMDVIRPVPKPPARPGLGDFDVTTADQSRRIPVFWGKPWLAGPNLVWYGDLYIKKIIQKVGTFVKKKQVIGYKYFVGLHLVFGYSDGDARLLNITFGDSNLDDNDDGNDDGTNGEPSGKDDGNVWSGNMLSGTGVIDSPELWGGEEGTGGISGTFQWESGGATQGQNAYLRRVLGVKVPAYRRVCAIVANQIYHGTSTSLQMWKIQAQRLVQGLASGYHDIAGEANGAEIQYELMTNNDWGLGLTPDRINTAEMRAVAKRIAEEGLGMSLIWDNAKSLDEIMKEIDRHLDALTYQDPNTGLWTMRLIRDDYDIKTLPRLNVSNCVVNSFARPTADELVNEVKVIYAADTLTGKPVPVMVQDLAAYQNRRNQKISSELEYPGFTKSKIAIVIANRDLRALSYPFARLQVTCNRTFSKVRPVDRVVLDWPPLGIANMPCIVLEKNIGKMGSNQIQMTLVQDTFGVGQALYTETGGSGWTPPSRQPLPPTKYRMDFAPYWSLSVDDDSTEPTAAVPMLLVKAPNTSHLGFDLQYTDPGLGGVYTAGEESQPFTPTATLAYDYLETGASVDRSGTLLFKDFDGGTFETTNLEELRRLGTGLILIDDEWMGIVGITSYQDGSFVANEVYRGLLDTVPRRHLAGATIWFVGMGAARTPTNRFPFMSGTYGAKIITRALGGTIPAASAPTLTIDAQVRTDGQSVRARPLLPYPPRALAINGSTAPGLQTGTLRVTWAFANKEQEANRIYTQDEAVAKPADVSYRAYLYDDAGTLQESRTGLTVADTTFSTWPAAGYVQVEAVNTYGTSPRATLWFGRPVDYSATDAAPQLFLADAGPSTFVRMAD